MEDVMLQAAAEEKAESSESELHDDGKFFWEQMHMAKKKVSMSYKSFVSRLLNAVG